MRTLTFLTCLLVIAALTACSDDTPQEDPPPLGEGFVEDAVDNPPDEDPTDPDPPEDIPSTPDVPEEVIDEPDPPRVPFNEGPYGFDFRQTVGPFTVQTTEGPWNFEEAWTGRESYIFLQYTNDPQQSEDLRNFLEGLWFGGGTQALSALLANSPSNVHYFFTSFDQDAEVDVARMEVLVDEAITGMGPLGAVWRNRVHFVTQPIWQTEGWIAEMMMNTGWLWFGIDQNQAFRQLGGLFDPARGTPRLSAAGYDATYFNFEFRRQAELDAEGDVTLVKVYESERIRGNVRDVVFPSEEEMAGFDTMALDVSAFCPEHLDSNCGEWDYQSHLFVCDLPQVMENPHAETACQARVAGQEAIEEVLGTCAGTEEPCAGDDVCGEEVLCEGYVAPQEGIEAIEADTIACACETVYGALDEARQHVCNNEGMGYAACNCDCGTEIGRWITTYGREGRWVTDISPFMAFFKRGGLHRLRMSSGNTYDFDFDIRLSNQNKGHRPVEARFLWGGGRFNENYNTNREPIAFEVPEGTSRVELVTYITGHGWGVEVDNCAEFCNHTHHFDLNGEVFTKDHPEAGTAEGCINQIDDGVVPNQYGTWPFGRGGWCPGLDVKPWVVDVTDALEPGENTLTYRGLFQGSDYVPRPAEQSNGGFGANINMRSYLVFHR